MKERGRSPSRPDPLCTVEHSQHSASPLVLPEAHCIISTHALTLHFPPGAKPGACDITSHTTQLTMMSQNVDGVGAEIKVSRRHQQLGKVWKGGSKAEAKMANVSSLHETRGSRTWDLFPL